MDWLVRFYLH